VRLDRNDNFFDNADTEKESASTTYDKRFGLPPIFAHLEGGQLATTRGARAKNEVAPELCTSL
jgi:hypothetical protein